MPTEEVGKLGHERSEQPCKLDASNTDARCACVYEDIITLLNFAD